MSTVPPRTVPPSSPPGERRPSVSPSSPPTQSASTVSVIEALLRRRSLHPSLAPGAGAMGPGAALDALVPSIPPQPRLPREVQSERLSVGVPAPGSLPSPLPAFPSVPSPPPVGPEVRAVMQAIPRRLPPAASPQPMARMPLLLHLAAACDGRAQAELIGGAAMLAEHMGDFEAAREHYANALSADEGDPQALRALRVAAMQAGDVGRAASLLQRELAGPASAREVALTCSALAELERSARGDRAIAEREARAALEADPRALTPWLLLGQLEVAAGSLDAAAEAWRSAAGLWAEGPFHGALMLLAGRTLLASGDTAGALALLEGAAREAPERLAVQLERHRAATAAEDVDAAIAALRDAVANCPGGATREGLTRALARLWLDRKQDPAAALRTLGVRGPGQLAPGAVDSRPSLRLQARAAEAAGDAESMRASLSRWAAQAGGTERALCRLWLSLDALDAGDGALAREHLADAIEADAQLGLCQLVAEWVERRLGDEDARRAPRGLDGDADAALETAARHLIRGDEDAFATLAPALDGGQPDPTVLELVIDALSERGDAEALSSLVAQRASRLATTQRLGPRLTLLDLAREAGSDLAGRELSDLVQLSDGQPAVLVEQRWAAQTSSARSTAWRRIAEVSRGAHAAFAWVQAGDALVQAGQASQDAYVQAERANRGDLVASLVRARLARERGDFGAQVEEERRLAERAAGPRARATHWLRLAGLVDDPAESAAALERAVADRADDLLLLQQMLSRSGVAQSEPVAQFEQLRRLAEGSSGTTAVALRLRAAGALEGAKLWSDAGTAYRQLLDRPEGAAFARAGLMRCLRAEDDVDGLLELLAAEEIAEGGQPAAYERASLLADTGRLREAVAQYEALAAAAPEELAPHRALQRLSQRLGEAPLLEGSQRALLERLSHPDDRMPYVRQLARLFAQRGDRGQRDELLCEMRPRAAADDIWYAVALEGAARRREDLEGVVFALERIGELLDHPLERASVAMRAAEAVEAHDIERAVAVLAPAAEAAPEHPVASDELARIARQAGELSLAARAYEAAALAAPGQARALRLWYTAGCLWQDALLDNAAARFAFEQAARRDLRYQQTFDRLRHVLEAQGDRTALCALLMQRIRVDDEVPAALYLELADAQAARGEPSLEIEALEACVEAYPGHLVARARLAEAHATQGQWAPAAENLVALARLTTDGTELRQAFFQLGEIYTRHLPDLRRAEIAFNRCLAIDPGDAEAVERLIDVYRLGEQPQRAVKAAQQLRELASDDESAERATLRLAKLLMELGRPELAERELNDYLQKHPTSEAVAEVLATGYEAEGDRRALSTLMHRSIHALRGALSADPGALTHLRAMHRLVAGHVGPQAAASVRDVADVFGHPQSAFLEAAEEPATPWRPDSEPECRLAVGLLVPSPLGPRTVDFFRLAAPVLEEVLPLRIAHGEDMQQGALPATLQSATERLRFLFAHDEVRVHLGPGYGCVVRSAHPLSFVIGHETLAGASPAELLSLLLGCAARAGAGLHVALRGTEDQFGDALHALCAALDSTHLVPEDHAEGVEAIGTVISRTLQRADRATMVGALHAMAFEYSTFETATLRNAADALGLRAGLVLGGSCTASVSGIMLEEGHGRLKGATASRALLVSRSPRAQRLLDFALSERHFEVLETLVGDASSGGGAS